MSTAEHHATNGTGERAARTARSERSRRAMAGAALELLLEHGLDGVTVERIAARAGVTRRTFSRHFADREDALVEFLRADTHRINDALRARPADEPPLTAYARAVADWFRTEYARADALRLARRHALLRRVGTEPRLFAAHQRARLAAEADSVAIIADRMAVDPARDPRPAVIVGVGAGTLAAATLAWARGDDPGALPRLVRAHFAVLPGLLAPGDGTEAPDARAESP